MVKAGFFHDDIFMPDKKDTEMKHWLKGNTTAIFNKNMLESMSIQILPTYCFCCTILLIIKINQLCSPPVSIHFLCETTDQTQ